jgi:hypothetical protein
LLIPTLGAWEVDGRPRQRFYPGGARRDKPRPAAGVEKFAGGPPNGDLNARAEAVGLEALVAAGRNSRRRRNLAGRHVCCGGVLTTTSWPRVGANVTPVTRAPGGSRPCDHEAAAFT